MRRIKLSAEPPEVDFSKRFVDDADYDELIDEDVEILRPNGEPLLVLVKRGVGEQAAAAAWSKLKRYKSETSNRGISSGADRIRRVNKDGSISNVNVVKPGWEVQSGIVGFFERTPRIPFCRPCAWNDRKPEKLLPLLPMVRDVDALFAQHVPGRYGAQRGFADRTPADFLLGGTVFTTLTINKNFRTACHKDAGDLAEGFSCLTVFRQGAYSGGHIVLPRWRLAAKLDTRDVVMFDAHEFHGNTQIVPLTKGATRCSVVFYYRELMVHCLPPAQELERAKNRRRGEPLFP